MADLGSCFHCGEPMPRGERRSVVVNGEHKPVCCAGCEAVATLIHSAGLDGYYRIRSTPGPRPETPASGPDEWDVFDRPQLQANFLRTLDDGQSEATVVVQNISCPACAWLIEHSLHRIDGVDDVQVNPASGRALLRFRPERAPLSKLMRTMAQLGYRPHPTGSGESIAVEERRTALKRLAVAGFGMMQVSTYAVSVWFGAFQGIDPAYRDFLNIISWLVTTPVLFYSGRPFFQGALRDLRARRVGMDVPIALGMALAYVASIWNTIAGIDRVYFDSVTMFVFFLLVGRYVEMTARHKAAHTTEALAQLIPPTARRLENGVETRVAVAELAVGDTVAVASGEAVPADGVVVWGEARLDESMLTGESKPQRRLQGDTVVAGSINVSHPFRLRVERLGQDTVLSTIGRLLERAQAQRPRLAHAADWIAGHFVVAVLFIAAGVFAFWLPSDPQLAFQAALAVLVVSCPCALGLATPSALVAGTDRLAQDGLLVARADALETLAKVTHVVFDKTGTLTTGDISIDQVVLLRADFEESQAKQLASALEHHSAHPIARAFADIDTPYQAEAIEAHPAGGLEGRIAERRLRLGTPAFVAALSNSAPATLPADQASWIALGDDSGTIALFRLIDRLRPEAEAAIAALRRLDIGIEIASGDQAEPVQAVAERLGITHFASRLTPAGKLNRIRALQRAGAVVAVVGDGVNDAPVLAGADVSIALGSGTALAQTSAAMILLGDSLRPLVDGVVVAQRTARVVRQNLGWALLYNVLALPLAAGGWLHPWMAAVGMSVSSLVVVINAMQLNRKRRQPAQTGATEAEPLTTGEAY